MGHLDDLAWPPPKPPGAARTRPRTDLARRQAAGSRRCELMGPRTLHISESRVPDWGGTRSSRLDSDAGAPAPSACGRGLCRGKCSHLGPHPWDNQGSGWGMFCC